MTLDGRMDEKMTVALFFMILLSTYYQIFLQSMSGCGKMYDGFFLPFCKEYCHDEVLY